MRFLSWLDAVRTRITEREATSARRREKPAAVASQLESLEGRSLLSASALIVDGELNVISDSNENIEIGSLGAAGSETVQLLINGVVATTVSSVPTSAITSIVVRGGNLQNTIDLSTVSRATYPNLLGIEVDAGHGADTILGSVDIDETLEGNHGDDFISCQDGDSTVLGDDGNDTIDGAGGNDSLLGEDGNDSITGGDGDDTIDAHDGDDVVDAGAGNDNVVGGDGEDTMQGGDGNDTLNGMMGTDEIDGGAGNDSLLGGSGNDSLLGSGGDDTIIANDGRDTLDGGTDNDILDGGNDEDSMLGGDGNDSLAGGADNDLMRGNGGADTLLGGAGQDTLEGNEGDDQLRGQGSNDTIYGGAGFDLLDGGTGDDFQDAGEAPSEPVPVAPIPARLFAVADDGRNSIVELDPTTGRELNRFATPEPINASGDALAFDGTSLFFLNGFGTNTLWELNPDTGSVVDSDVVPRPTNQRYDGLAALNGLIYIQDAVNDDILIYDPVSDGVTQVLDVNAGNPGTNLLGGLAGALDPDRLIATLANGRSVVEINPLTGLITSRFTPTTRAAGSYSGVGVVDDLIYLGSSRVTATSALRVSAALDVFNRQGKFLETLALPYAVSAIGGDDVGTFGTPVISEGQFDIVLNLPGNLTTSQRMILESAATRWESIIKGDLPDVLVPGVGLIDDLVVNVQVKSFDGPGGTMGQTTIDVQRQDTFLPAMATIEMDAEDLTQVEADGLLDDAMLHELGHALGFGTVWAQAGLIAGAGTSNPRFLGAQARVEYDRRFNTTEPNVPVENAGGPGSANMHWRESRFGNELMSSVMNPGSNPLSRITIASMADLGYQVDLNQADQYAPTRAVSSLPRTSTSSTSPSGMLVVSASGQRGRWLLSNEPAALVHSLAPGEVRPWSVARSTTTTGVASTSTGVAARVVVGASATSNVASSTLTTLDFSERPTASADGQSVAGATFDFQIDGVDSVDAVYNTSIGLNSLTAVNLSDPVLEGNAAGVLSVDFAAPATSISFAVARQTTNNVANAVRVSLFDRNLMLISTSTVNTALLRSFSEGVFSYAGTTGVRRMQLDFTSAPPTAANGPRFAIDNLSFDLSGATIALGTGGGDTLLGGDGNDSLIGSDANDLLNGNAGNDTLEGGDGDDNLQGGSGNDRLAAGFGNDMLRGGAGKDTLLGDAGDDFFVSAPGEGIDSLDGGDGSDRFEMRGTKAAETFAVGQKAGRLTVSIGSTVQSLEANIELVQVLAAGGSDRIFLHDLTGVGATELRLFGGNGNDRIIADPNAGLSDIRLAMVGEAGDDSLVGTDSGESLLGGDGDDTIIGNGGNDTIDGGAGDDSMTSGAGNDVVDGGEGLSTIEGGDGDDSLTGSVFNDELNGGAGNDTLIGLNGDDILNGMEGNDSLVGGADNDSLLGGSGDDTLDGGTDNDTLNGQDGRDRIDGFHGNDSIVGGAGNDTILGGDGEDTITADGGDDLIRAGDGNDLVLAGDGNDVILGGDGNDTLRGGAGSDIALGEDGNDSVDGQGATDTVSGGEGTDTVTASTGELDEFFQLDPSILAILA